MKVKLRGVRGSLPSPIHPSAVMSNIQKAAFECCQKGLRTESEVNQYLQTRAHHHLGGYGGNTSCVEVSTDKQTIIIDGGTGIRALGMELTKPCELHIFMTHFHWDHLIGLLFFNPIFIPGYTIHFYAVQEDLEHVIRTLFKKPFFPVDFEKLGAKILFHQMAPRKSKTIGDISITPYELDHPDPCWGFRVESAGKSFAHCVDTECLRTSATQLGPDLPLYQNADLMVFDAQYTIAQTVQRVSWGHAAAPIGLDIAMRENIKRVCFVHHDPNATEEDIATAEDMTRDYYESHLKAEKKAGRQVFEVNWQFAQEGEVIILE